MSKGRGQNDRRRAPRVPCRLHGKIAKGRERIRVRILDVSEGGLCLLFSEWLSPKQVFQISIDVPNHATATVKAEIWHVRRETLRGSSSKAWIAGAILRESDAAYDELLKAAGLERTPAAATAPAAPATSPSTVTSPSTATSTSPASKPAAATAPAAKPSPPRAQPAPARPSPPPAAPASNAARPTPASAVAPEAPDSLDDDAIDGIESRIYRLRCKQRGSPRTRVLSIGATSEEEARKQAEASLGSGWMLLEVAEA